MNFDDIRILTILIGAWCAGMYLLLNTRSEMERYAAIHRRQGNKFFEEYALGWMHYLTIKLIGLVLVGGPSCLLYIFVAQRLNHAH
jgi:hypothetical protein